jgi:cbb3-type cytochrome oxidase subunit 3
MIEVLFGIAGIYIALVSIGVVLITLRPDRNIIYQRLKDERLELDNDIKFYFKVLISMPFSIWYSVIAIIRG